mmetsp:Transcript_14043/g.18313  ORF Transcript_14043/g.18313 Transcript_14043/m.18313 type:complete len:414 (+) Transcript_14043:106-1347(+)
MEEDQCLPIELHIDEAFAESCVDEICLAREIQEAWCNYGRWRTINVRVLSHVPCNFGPMLKTEGIKKMIQYIRVLDLVEADIEESDVANLTRAIPDLKELQFQSKTFEGTNDILDSLQNSTSLERLSVVRSAKTEIHMMGLIGQGIARIVNLTEIELDLCGCEDEAMSILTDSLLGLEGGKLQSLTLTYSGYGSQISQQSLPNLSRLVNGMRSSSATLKLSLQDVPTLFSSVTEQLKYFMASLEENPPLELFVGDVGLKPDSIAMLCAVGARMQAHDSELGLMEDGLLDSENLKMVVEKIPYIKARNLTLYDKNSKPIWSEEQQDMLLAATHRNSALFHLDCHFGRIGDDFPNRQFLKDCLDPIFERNKCMDLARIDSQKDIPLCLWPKVLEIFGQEQHWAAPTFLFLLSQSW